MNTFTYNGITLNNPDIKELASEAVYDSADISVVVTKTVYRVSGVLQTGANSLGVNIVAARVALMQPRKTMVCTLDGVDVTYLTFPNGDDVGGPKPRKCTVNEIVGSNFAFVNLEIEVGQQEASEVPSNIISHNYDVTHDLDSRFYTTRTVRGTIIVRQTADSNNPDALRGLLVPPLPNGFKRESMSFLLGADGLKLDYTIVDKEVFRVAPQSAVEAHAVFTQQMSNYVWYAHFSMDLKGHKNQDQLSMLNDIITVCNSRINLADPTVYIQQASIDEDLYDNTVRFQVSAMVSAQAGDKNANAGGTLPAGTNIFTGIPLSDENTNVVLGPYGTSLLQAAKAAFYDPTSPSTDIAFAQEVAQSSDVGTAPGSEPETTPPEDQSGASNISTAQVQNPYTKFEEVLEYSQVMGTVMLPSTYATAPGKVYQMHNPYMVIVQQGTSSRTGKPVEVPSPQTTNTGILRVKKVTPFVPVLLPDKQTYQFGASWYYEILVPFTTDDFVQVGSNVNTQLGSEGVGYWLPENPAFTFDPNDPTTQMTVYAPIQVDPIT